MVDGDPVLYRRIVFICVGIATLIICVILLLKTPALNFEESGEELRAATEASRATTAAEAQAAAAAKALAARLESVPTTIFFRVLAAATDPANVDATCAICLVDMESADFVKRLPTCHHW